MLLNRSEAFSSDENVSPKNIVLTSTSNVEFAMKIGQWLTQGQFLNVKKTNLSGKRDTLD